MSTKKVTFGFSSSTARQQFVQDLVAEGFELTRWEAQASGGAQGRLMIDLTRYYWGDGRKPPSGLTLHWTANAVTTLRVEEGEANQGQFDLDFILSRMRQIANNNGGFEGIHEG